MASPTNSDRTRWAAAAVDGFVRAAGSEGDLWPDAETVIADLLADLMHWCDAPNVRGRALVPVDFGSALGRARRHYRREYMGG